MRSIILQRIVPQVKIMERPAPTSHIKFIDPVKLLILQKKQVLYATDGCVIVQLIKLQQNSMDSRDDLPTPFNRIRTNYYNFHTKHAHLFKFNEFDCSEEYPQFPSAYEPEFHFQDRLLTYKQKMGNLQFNNVSEVLLIREWGFRIVNIANSGYYGIVLEIFHYQQRKEKYNISPLIHSILYEKQLAKTLEQFRTQDMRKQIGQPQRSNPISLCYYKKNVRTTHISKNIMSNFVTVDRFGKILKIDSKIKQHYLAMGNISGVLRFIRPLVSYSQSKKSMINFNLIQSLPEKNTSHEVDHEEVCSSEQDVDDNIEIDVQSQHLVQNQDDSDEQEQEQEEPLKLIYMKQLQKMQII